MDDFSRALAAAAVIDGQHFTLPGCGTLQGTYVPARVDHLARTVQPPTLEVTWSKQPSAEAQTFADLLAASGATSAEASATEATWVETLHAGDPIEVGDLGRLHLDRQTGAIEFDANEAGLRGAYWSGGPVSVEPLARRPESATKIEFDSGKHVPPAPRRRRARGGSPRIAAFATGAVALLLAVFAYLAFGGQGDAESPRVAVGEEGGKVVPVRGERLNRSPREASQPASSPPTESAPSANGASGSAEGRGASTDHRATAPPPAAAIEPQRKAPTPGDPTQKPAPGVDAIPDRRPAGEREESPTVPPVSDPATLAGQASDFDPDAVQAVVILGSFGSADNAARLTERVAEAGYVPYVGQRGRLTQVGVTVSASSDNEVAVILEQLREAYNRDAYVVAVD